MSTYERLVNSQNFFSPYLTQEDLSRFGREYINSGKYIHRLFPVLGVRLIAINDNIDTITRDESSEFSITLKNLMNDNYSRDISVKVRSQLQVKRKHGDFICPFAPYGYQKCEGNHNRIEPDPYAATVVYEILLVLGIIFPESVVFFGIKVLGITVFDALVLAKQKVCRVTGSAFAGKAVADFLYLDIGDASVFKFHDNVGDQKRGFHCNSRGIIWQDF